MGGAARFEATLLAGADVLLGVHARELPQRDDLCGAFCGALALHAAGIESIGGEPLDQDAVALAAGSVVADTRGPGILPEGETGRRDYRLVLPRIDEEARSGTTAAGVLAAIAAIAQGRVEAIPLAGPWTTATVAALFDLAAGLEHPVSLLANLATRHLWGANASVSQLLGHLLDGSVEGPPPDWDVGHFACIVGRVRGPAGHLYALADTYPSLGAHGVHMQPGARLAAAIDRRDMPAGGVIAVVMAQDRAAVHSGLERIGLVEAIWDNGTAAPVSRG